MLVSALIVFSSVVANRDFLGLAGVVSALVTPIDDVFLVIRSHIILKEAELTFPRRARYQSPRLLQIYIMPALAFDLRSICPSFMNSDIDSASLPYSFVLIFSSFFITSKVLI